MAALSGNSSYMVLKCDHAVHSSDIGAKHAHDHCLFGTSKFSIAYESLISHSQFTTSAHVSLARLPSVSYNLSTAPSANTNILNLFEVFSAHFD